MLNIKRQFDMKQIYEIPEVTIFEVGVCEQMIAGSITEVTGGYNGSGKSHLGNDNNLDDQDSPWYRR